ncbi:MAG: carbohydrate kinase [Cyclobacteriaceae bacterium]|nr:carbohydrate kinase [Cyclobacteriaceae bacterium]
MHEHKYILGLDVGSSSVKTTLLDAESGKVAASATFPAQEMKIEAPKAGWAEQDPEAWWANIKLGIASVINKSGASGADIGAIGISYQMHGLVLVGKDHKVLRSSIIWCDSRAVETGNKAFHGIGPEYCLNHYLNSPGNFTASKLKWVKEQQPELFEKVYKAMLPGDFVAMKLTGEINTTISGLSEGVFWDFKEEKIADRLLQYYGIEPGLLPEVVPTFSIQGKVSAAAARETGLNAGTPVSYRAGDQPNNAFSLNVLKPGEIAATAGTSGVVYGIIDQAAYDPKSRVNTFVHVNHQKEAARYGVLLCINGTGILNSWMRNTLFGGNYSYEQMNQMAAEAPVGSDGLVFMPFGNGAERILENKELGAGLHNLNFNIHQNSHMLRAAQEGIVYSLNFGFNIMKDMGMPLNTVRAGHANMFLSPLFREAFANTTQTTVELYNTDGAQGAARGAGIGASIYANTEQAFTGLEAIKTIEPDVKLKDAYAEAYQYWLSFLAS